MLLHQLQFSFSGENNICYHPRLHILSKNAIFYYFLIDFEETFKDFEGTLKAKTSLERKEVE